MSITHKPIFDSRLWQQQRHRAYKQTMRNSQSPWLTELYAEIVGRIECLRVPCKHLLLVGIEGAQLQSRVPRVFEGAEVTVIDVVPYNGMKQIVQPEDLQLQDAAYNWIIAPLWLQLVNDLPGVLVQLRRALAPQGVFLAAMLGENSLLTLRRAAMAADLAVNDGRVWPRVGPAITIQDAAALLQRAGFGYPVTDVDQRRYAYPVLHQFLQELRHVGWGNCLVERALEPGTRQFLHTLESSYRQLQPEDKDITIELDWVHFFGRGSW
jgi:hypothetical protein